MNTTDIKPILTATQKRNARKRRAKKRRKEAEHKDNKS